MPEFGLLKNLTSVVQYWGNFEIGAHSIGRVPATIAQQLRERPVAEFQVLDQDDQGVFHRTEHEPFSPRYLR